MAVGSVETPYRNFEYGAVLFSDRFWEAIEESVWLFWDCGLYERKNCWKYTDKFWLFLPEKPMKVLIETAIKVIVIEYAWSFCDLLGQLSTF